MKKYTVGFKNQAVMHYYRIRSRQLTAETFRMARTHLRRRIATYEYDGLAALEHPQAMADKKTIPLLPTNPIKKKEVCVGFGWYIKNGCRAASVFFCGQAYTTASSFFFCGLAKLSRSRPNIISRGLATSTDE